MCLRQEVEYEHCFDFMFLDGGFEKTFPVYLRDEFGMDVVDLEQFKAQVMRLLEKMHDEGVVRPVSYLEGSFISRFACPTCDSVGWVSFEQLQKGVK